MRKLTLVLVMMFLLPAMALAQNYVRVSSVYGPVEWKVASADRFVPLQPSTQMVRVGDQIRTGAGATLTLELPDGSYMVVSENSTLTMQEFWAPSLPNLIKVAMGKVRFYIQRLGGRPNPYTIQTPTALISVRGTTFEVTVDDSAGTEVACFEGRVAVETIGFSDREVILGPGSHTQVRAGAPPMMPVAMDEPLTRNRVIPIFKKDTNDAALAGKNAAAMERLIRDNDRRNRPADPLMGPPSRTNSETQRAKPTLRYPEH